MPSSTALQDTLRLGLTIVSEQWHYKAKDWVTSVHAADIDDDGNIEIILGSRDGRVHSLTREGDLRWQRIVGNKTWVGSLATVALPGRSHQGSRIIVGTRDGFLYVVDKMAKSLARMAAPTSMRRMVGQTMPRRPPSGTVPLRRSARSMPHLSAPPKSSLAPRIALSTRSMLAQGRCAGSFRPAGVFARSAPAILTTMALWKPSSAPATNISTSLIPTDNVSTSAISSARSMPSAPPMSIRMGTSRS